jgi:hypothetical protein
MSHVVISERTIAAGTSVPKNWKERPFVQGEGELGTRWLLSSHARAVVTSMIDTLTRKVIDALPVVTQPDQPVSFHRVLPPASQSRGSLDP